MARRIISWVLCISFLFQQSSFAQVAAVELNLGAHLARMSNNLIQENFRPIHLRYLSFDALNNNIKVLLDKGIDKKLDAAQVETSTKELLKYFLIGVSLPNDTFWVNLRPDSQDQIIEDTLAQTDVGKIMLEADLQLKKDTALFTSPHTPEGKLYWDKLYKKAASLYGNENVTIPTITRPWILPNEIIVRETSQSAYIYKATLKVMLEQDYLKDSTSYNFKDERAKIMNEYSSDLIRELIIPKLIKEVNTAKRYAGLRQVFYSLVFARWFKTKFNGSNGMYASLINSKNLTNLTSTESWSKTTYFKQYQKSFTEGEYNIKEPVYTPSGQVIRSYFSGGVVPLPNVIGKEGSFTVSSSTIPVTSGQQLVDVTIDPDDRSIHVKPANVSSPLASSTLTFSKPIGLDKSRQFYKEIMKQGNVIVLSMNMRNPVNMRGIFRAAKEKGAPVIIQRSISEFVDNYLPADLAWDAAIAAQQEGFTGSWMLKLDHATVSEDTPEAIAKVVKFVEMAKEAGFGSYAIDCSKLVDFSKSIVSEQQRRNFEVSAKIVQKTGIEDSAWEGEIGEIVGDHKALSTVEEAVAFVEGIESLGVRPPVLMAINNGSEHGNVEGMKIDLEKTKEINDELSSRWDIFINQHGITGTKLDLFPKLAEVGIRNGNIGTHWQNIVWDVVNRMQPEIADLAKEALGLTDLGDKAQKKVWDKKVRYQDQELMNLLKPETEAAIIQAVYESAKEHFDVTKAQSVKMASSTMEVAKPPKVAINGFGRIGKLVLKAYLENPDNKFDIVAINDLTPIETLAHLFRYDSTFGRFKGEVKIEEGNILVINGKRIQVFSEKDPRQLPWGDLGVEIVVEATGKFNKREGASQHLEAGAKKVVLTAPGENVDLTVVLGVNDDRYKPQKHNIISNASCTTNDLAPVVKVLNETFGIKYGNMVTVHAATNDQNVLDMGHNDLRRARATLGNIIPTKTGAAKAIGLVIPQLKGKLDGFALRVPTIDVSTIVLNVVLKKNTTVEELNAALKKAAEEGPLSNYLGFTTEPLVSSDFLGNPKSGIVDASYTKVIDGKMAQVVIWYDNEWGYSNRTIDLLNYMIGKETPKRAGSAARPVVSSPVKLDKESAQRVSDIAKEVIFDLYSYKSYQPYGPELNDLLLKKLEVKDTTLKNFPNRANTEHVEAIKSTIMSIRQDMMKTEGYESDNVYKRLGGLYNELEQIVTSRWTIKTLVKDGKRQYLTRPVRLMAQANDKTDMKLLKSLGADGAMSGHSETREAYGLTNETINALVARSHSVFNAINVMAIGEPETMRYPKGHEKEAQLTPEGWDFIRTQVTEGLVGLSREQILSTIIAYEPIWAIGPKAIRQATPKEAEEVQNFIRNELLAKIVPGEEKNIIIQYGGSMSAKTAADLMAQVNIDGGLIGGASLKKEDALNLIKTIVETVRKQKTEGTFSGRIPVLGFNLKAEVGGPKMEAAYLKELMDFATFINNNLAGIDLENEIRIFFAVSDTDITLFDRALRGENPVELLDLGQASLPNHVELAVSIDRLSAVTPGAYTSNITAEALKLAGVKSVIVPVSMSEVDARVLRAKEVGLNIIKVKYDLKTQPGMQINIDTMMIRYATDHALLRNMLNKAIVQESLGLKNIIVVPPALAREAYVFTKAQSESKSMESSASSTILDKVAPGGIDFRALPMIIQPMGSFKGLNFSLPKLSASELASFDLAKSAEHIEKMLDAQMRPSDQGILEFMAASVQKGVFESDKERVLIWLAKIGIIDEAQCCNQESSNAYKEALVLAETLI